MPSEDIVWRPHMKQEHFLEIPDDIFEGFYGGAVGGGKSELLMMLPIARGWYKHPKFRALLLRRTYPELEESLIARSKQWYPATGATYDKTNKRWEWPWGAAVKFGYANYEEDVRQYDTTEYQYLGFDELTSFTEWMYRYLTTRCRSTIPTIPSIVRSASNPGNVGHGWVRKRFVEPAINGYTIIEGWTVVDGRKIKNLRMFIPARLTDNPHLMRTDPDYINRLAILPYAERKAKMDGDWWTFSGQVFDEWRDKRMPDEPENALHVTAPFSIPSWWPKVIAIDWGFEAMLWCGWFAIAPNKRVYLYQEYTSKREKIAYWASKVRDLTGDLNSLKTVVLDPSAWHQRGDEKTIAGQFMEHSGMRAERADNDRLGGKMLMHELLRWESKFVKPRDMGEFDAELAQRVLRINGMKAYNQYVDSFIPEQPESDLPRFQVFSTCKEFIKCLPMCVYNRKEGKDPEDVAEFDGDDPYDGCRYGIKAVDRYIREAMSRGEEWEKRSNIIQKFEATGDYNSMHRALEKLEARKKTSGTVLRYRRLGDVRRSA